MKNYYSIGLPFLMFYLTQDPSDFLRSCIVIDFLGDMKRYRLEITGLQYHYGRV